MGVFMGILLCCVILLDLSYHRKRACSTERNRIPAFVKRRGFALSQIRGQGGVEGVDVLLVKPVGNDPKCFT